MVLCCLLVHLHLLIQRVLKHQWLHPIRLRQLGQWHPWVLVVLCCLLVHLHLLIQRVLKHQWRLWVLVVLLIQLNRWLHLIRLLR